MQPKKIAAVLTATLLLAVIPLSAKPEKEYKTLPPGLAKKADEGKPLPPGWQKKLHKGDILDKEIYARGKVVVPLGKDGTVTINVDGTLLKLYEQSRRIIDIVNP